jgi:hypothetical protein
LSFINGRHNEIEFEVTDQQKRDTKSVCFGNCSAVDFVDIDILKRFPNLNGLSFNESNIPILKTIFTVELKMIQYLDLWNNKIKSLGAHVFDELVELKRIGLGLNELEEISHPIFAKNKKLVSVYLHNNQLKLLHPNLFDGLNFLKGVQLESNPIINKKFGQSNMKMLSVELKPLFDNYFLKYGWMRIKELELVSIICALVNFRTKYV